MAQAKVELMNVQSQTAEEILGVDEFYLVGSLVSRRCIGRRPKHKHNFDNCEMN
ncbi:hypothetical protein JYQ62_03500 [Nostoc sp. UHCC 0702]|nr:hypothetical protein JYQ62_03500 [Nostoc sp. UHCC 0702]